MKMEIMNWLLKIANAGGIWDIVVILSACILRFKVFHKS